MTDDLSCCLHRPMNLQLGLKESPENLGDLFLRVGIRLVPARACNNRKP